MSIFGPTKNELLLMNENNYLKAEISRLMGLLSPEHNNIENLRAQAEQLQVSIDQNANIVNQLFNRTSELNLEIQNLNSIISEKQHLLSLYDLELFVQECGLYKPNYEFATSDFYKDRLTDIRNHQKQLIRYDRAVLGYSNWSVNNSESQGRAMVNDTKKLLLRAFNVECDNIVSNVKVSNFTRSIDKIYKISDQISKLGKIMSISITPEYIDLKIQEVKLALDYQQKKIEEKERIKELKALEREEAKAQREIEAERKRLEKEQMHYKNALSSLIAQIDKFGESEDLLEKKEQLENQLNDTSLAIQNVDYREANRKAGYVYIISNIGAFGENVYKIGMTRRLDPTERVDELGDASVPFGFDIHATIFTEDAPRLEAALHNAFESRKLNKVNTRREFFSVTLEEIKAEVRKNHDKTVEWKDVPDAEQYRQSLLLSGRTV